MNSPKNMQLSFAPELSQGVVLTVDGVDVRVGITKEIVVFSEFFVGLEGKPGTIGDISEAISQDARNSLQVGSDGKLFVEDATDPDPLVFYILAKG